MPTLFFRGPLVWLAAGRPLAGSQAPQSAIDVTLASRAMQPGELIVFTMRVHGDASSADVSLFGRRATAFQLEDGRWRALVGIDLDQKPAPSPRP